MVSKAKQNDEVDTEGFRRKEGHWCCIKILTPLVYGSYSLNTDPHRLRCLATWFQAGDAVIVVGTIPGGSESLGGDFLSYFCVQILPDMSKHGHQPTTKYFQEV